MNKITEKEWLEDFQEFVRNEGALVPDEISQTVLDRVRHELNPSPWLVFSKFLGTHAVVGTLSLALCDQFGISPFQTGFSLSDYFMEFGHSTCMVLCGVLFVGLSVLLCRAWVSPEDLRVLKKNAWLQVSGISMLSLGIFAAFGAEITFAIGVLWLIGAMAGGTALALFRIRTLRI